MRRVTLVAEYLSICVSVSLRNSETQKLRNDRGGQILIVVLWAMGLVSLAVGAVSQRMTHELRLSQLANQHLQRENAEQTALYHALAIVTEDEPTVDHLEEPWATGVDDQGQSLLQEGTITDEARKLNLNTASPEALKRLIEQVQPNPELDAAALAAAIADWRDTPEGSICTSRSPACHNAPLQTVGELLLVPGMTAALYDALLPYVTIYGDGAINLNTADPIVLSAAGLTAQQIAAIIQQRDAQPYTTVPPEFGSGFSVASSYFTLTTPTRRTILDRSGIIYE